MLQGRRRTALVADAPEAAAARARRRAFDWASADRDTTIRVFGEFALDPGAWPLSRGGSSVVWTERRGTPHRKIRRAVGGGEPTPSGAPPAGHDTSVTQ